MKPMIKYNESVQVYEEIPRALLKTAWDGKEAGKLMGMILGFQAEFNRQMRGEQSAFYRKYLDYRAGIMKTLGRQELSPYQLIDLEIAVVKDLADNFAPLRGHALASLNQIARYQRLRDERCNNDVTNMKSNLNAYQSLDKEYNDQEELLAKLSEGDPGWPIIREKLREMKREMHNRKSSYMISQQGRYYHTKSDQAFENLEYLLHDALMFSELIQHATFDYAEKLENIIPTILNVDSQGKYSRHMNDAIGRLENNAEKLAENMRRGTNQILSAHMTADNANVQFDKLEVVVNPLLKEFSRADKALSTR